MTRSLSGSMTRGLRQILLLLVVTACLFCVGLGRLPLLEPDEGRNAEAAREMLVSRDWITPHFDTLPYLDKPALYFWLVATSFRLGGVSEWTARFPSALMASATALLVWLLARRMFGGSAGLRAAMVVATSPLFIALARTTIFDMTLTFFVTLAMACFWCAEVDDFQRPWFDAALGGAAGLATLTKGPVGFLLPLLSIFAYQAARGGLQELKRWRWKLSLGSFLAAVLPWFAVVSIRHPDFPRYALWQESLVRFATGGSHRTGGPLYYVPVFLAGFLPWSFCLTFAGWNRLKRWKELRQESNAPVAFLLTWAAVTFVFFSISRSKLPAYFLPAVVPLSLLMAQVWTEVESAAVSGWPDWLTAAFATLIVLGLLVAAAPQLFGFRAVQVWAARKIPPTVMPFLRPGLLYTGLVLVGLGILGRKLAARARSKARSAAAFILLALTVPLLIVRWTVPLEIYATSSSSRQLAKTILVSPERDLPIYGYYYFRTSLPFYLRRPVGLVTADGSETTSRYIVSRFSLLRGQTPPAEYSLGAFGTHLPVLIDAKRLQELGHNSPEPFLLLVRNTNLQNLTRELGDLDPLWSGWQSSVWEKKR